MGKDVLRYPLVDGYIHHWLVAGPQAVPVEGLHRFGNPPDKAGITRSHSRPDAGIEGEPVEFGDCQIGESRSKWSYVRTRQDHQIDLSVFQPAVRFLQAWAYVEIESPKVQETAFVLATNGPADVWINGNHVHHQEHFHDSIPQPVRFQAGLKDGINRLMVRIEAVAARECAFGMAMQLAEFETQAEGADRVVQIPTSAPSSNHRLLLESIFEDCHLRQDVFARKEEITVFWPEGKATTTPFVIRMQRPDGHIYAEANRDGRRTEPRQPLGYPFQSPEGEYQLRFMPSPKEFYESNFRITRLREFYAATNVYSAQPYGTYAERRNECLTNAASRKDDLFGVIAKMEQGAWKDLEEKPVLEAVGAVTARNAGADVLLCGLLGVQFRYAGDERFPKSLAAPLEACILGFRYGEDDPGDDAMDFHGESHRILLLACEILAGQLYPQRQFANTGRPGSWHQERGERMALEWLQQRAGSGFEEWDSNSCFAEDVLALSTLTSLAKNPQLMEMAALVLDKLFFTMAVNSFQGVFGSTHGSASTSHIKTGYREATAGVTRLLWGMGIFNEHTPGAVSLACSSYELPPILAAIAADRSGELWSRERHGGAAGGAVVNKATYKTPDAMLCSAQDWYPGEPGGTEHIWQASLSPMTTVFTSHPACASENDSRRPNYWRGNAILPRVAQWKDTLIAVYQFPENDWMGFTHAYFPVHGMDEHDIRDGWAFARVGDGYLALAAARGLAFQTSGDNAYRELRSPGSPNIWLCQLGRAATDGSFGEFIEKVKALPVDFQGAKVELTCLRGDRLTFGWQGAFLINGKAQALDGFKHYDNSYCSCETGAPEMEIRYGMDALRLHFDEKPREDLKP
jgi:hypothetical protein